MARASKQDRAMLSAWRELDAHGKPVKAVRISPVGDVFLLTETPDMPAPSNDAGDEAEAFWKARLG